jgi:hypothetical protein
MKGKDIEVIGRVQYGLISFVNPTDILKGVSTKVLQK